MEMGGSEQIYQDKAIKENDGNDARHDQWVIMEGGNEISDSSSIESSFGDSTSSILSSSSSDMIDDATSPISSSLPSYGAAYELSELMASLPIKRGLSKYYEGQSESFASLACVKSIEDLAKKGRPCGRKMKPWKGCYGGGLDNQIYSPKATISKKTLSSVGRRGAALFSSCRPPIPLQKNL